MTMLDRLSRRYAAPLAAAVAIALILSSATGRAEDWSPQVKSIIDKARQEGKLQIVAPQNVFGGSVGNPIIEHGLNAMFGTNISIEWSPGPSFVQMASKLYQEMRAGQPATTDVFHATAVQISPYLDKELFSKIEWTKLWPGRITPELVEGDGRAIRDQTFLPGIVYNVKVSPWAKSVKVMDDVLKPEYKGKFGTTPFLAGFDVLLGTWGIDKTVAFVRKMSSQISGFIECDAWDRIASGEVGALVLDCTGAVQNTDKYRGKNILDTQIVSDAAARRYGYQTIPTNAAHPNAAILYTLYLISPEGQRAIALLDGADLDNFPDSLSGKRVAANKAEGVEFTDVTITWWRQHQSPEMDQALRDVVKIIREQ